MPSAWAINEDTGSPEYAARDLRRIAAGWLYPGVADRWGARQGVRPHSGDPVSVSGATWTVHDLTAVVYPGITDQAGPYVVSLPEESDSLDPADGSNDRIDALDLQVQDDDEDASGQRRARVVYVPGTPAADPDAEPVTDNSLRLATILVPSGGSPSPSVETLAQFTVASGGVLPVRDDDERPTAGRYAGMLVYNQDTDDLQRWDGSSWGPVQRGWVPITDGSTTNESFFDIDLTDSGRFPAGTFSMVRIRLSGQLDDVAGIWARINNAGSDDHRYGIIRWLFDDGTVESAFRSSGSGSDDWRVGHWGASASILDLELRQTDVSSAVPFRATSTTSGGSTNHYHTEAGGRLTANQLVNSIRFGRLSPATEYSSVEWFVEGYRP